MIDFCFKGGDKQSIEVGKYGARWVNNIKDRSLTFSQASFKKAVKYLMNNCFFQLGNKVFRQVIGIPMGSDPAPFFANLFLYHFESKWIKKIKKTDIGRARRFANTFRFIDDLTALNDGGEFEKSFKEIYPPELELKKENVTNTERSFLDLNIKIENNRFATSLYDKRDGFPFSIVRMPYLCSNIPSKMFYSAFGAEILRIARTTNIFNVFKCSSKILLYRAQKQGGDNGILKKTLPKYFGRHFEVFGKFCDTSVTFLNCIFE